MNRVDGAQFQQSDEQHLKTILENYKRYASKLNKNNPRAYKANGYELRLFVHYTDGTHEQFDATTIANLPTQGKKVSYANLVLKLGTYGELRDDWRHVQQNILTRANHAAYQRNAAHHLETHITIASLYKYSKAQNKIVGKTVQRKNGKAGWNEAFDQTDIDVLVDVFNDTNNNTNFNNLTKLTLDRLQLTAKQNGQIGTVETVKF